MSDKTFVSGESSVIYEDMHVIVYFYRGSSPFLIITFGDLTMLGSDKPFFAEQPVRKLNYCCVGFIAKNGNWFPRESIEKAERSISNIIEYFSTRILYGGSMGGYAAIKYSAVFQATQVIAFCPQWSISRKDWEHQLGRVDFKPGWEDRYDRSMDGMYIRPEDRSGRTYLFFDPRSDRDAAHAAAIEFFSGPIDSVKVPNVGHHVTRVFAGTDNFASIINSVLVSDIPHIKAMSRSLRSRSTPRLRKIVDWSKKRKGNWALASIGAVLKMDSGLFRNDTATLVRIFESAVEKGAETVALHSLKEFFRSSEDLHYRLILSFQFARRFRKAVFLTSYQSEGVNFDFKRGMCVVSSDISEQFVPVSLFCNGDELSFRLDMIGISAALHVDEGGAIRLGPGREGFRTGVMRLECFEEGFSVSFGGLYLSARKDGQLRFGSKQGKWEKFYLSFSDR